MDIVISNLLTTCSEGKGREAKFWSIFDEIHHNYVQFFNEQIADQEANMTR